MLTGAFIGVAVALGLMVVNWSKAKSGTGLPGQIETLLRDKGPMTLAQIAQAVGKPSFFGKGQVVQALQGLGSAGKLKIKQAPDGTPQLKKVDFITYEVLKS